MPILDSRGNTAFSGQNSLANYAQWDITDSYVERAVQELRGGYKLKKRYKETRTFQGSAHAQLASIVARSQHEALGLSLRKYSGIKTKEGGLFSSFSGTLNTLHFGTNTLKDPWTDKMIEALQRALRIEVKKKAPGEE